MNADEFKEKLANYLAAFSASSILVNDEEDSVAQNVCVLVPEGCVSLLIGKGGVNVSEIKAATGVDISFCKKEDSVHGLRKCFHSGTVGDVTKALYVLANFLNEISPGGGMGIVIKSAAAGAVIGKGGANLKSIRECTGCNISMEKSEEAIPAFGGRCLSLRHPDGAPHMLTRAAYLAIRSKGFASPTASENRAGFSAPMEDISYDTNSAYGYGPAAGMRDAKRFSPYGRPDVCAVHGKKRGKQFLRPSPTMPGQFTCLDEDPCKGVTNAPMGMGGMQMGNVPMAMGMGGMGMGMGGGMGMYGMDTGSVCALHGKKRGPNNLQPHPSNPNLLICFDHDMCKGFAQDSVSPSICAIHGKKRGAKNLQTHPTTAGLFVCHDEDMCK